MAYTKTRYEGVEYLIKKNGEKSFSIRYRVNGKLKRETIGTDTEGITAVYCKNIRAERMSKAKLGKYSPFNQNKKDIPTFGDIANKYLDSIKTLSDYKNTVGRYDNHLRTTFHNKQLDEITTDDIELFRNKKMKEVSFKTGRPYSNKTINDMTNLINTIYNYAISVEGIDIKSPAKPKMKKSQGKGIVRLNEDNARERYLTKDEIKELFEAIINRPNGRDEVTRYVLIFTKLALCTGGRITTILNIKKKDIDTNNLSVTLKDFKNDSTYKGFITQDILELLELDKLKSNDYVVGGTKTQIHRTSINKVLQPLLNDLFNYDLEVDDSQNRVVIHTLRHTFGSLLAIDGVPIYTIQKLMNHKSIDMTMRYSKLAPDSGRDFVANIFS